MSDSCRCFDVRARVVMNEPKFGGKLDFSGEIITCSDGEDYKRGYDEGHAQGLIDGQADGYKKGYDEGHKVGSESGYQTGKQDGLTEGYDNGYLKGKQDGYADGYEQGYSEGYTKGYEQGKAEGGLPEWDDDSPIIASGKSYTTSNVVWELTEKGTFRWKIIDNNNTTAKGFDAYICDSTALSTSPLAYQEICTKIKQIYIPDGIKRTEFHYAINCERIRVPDTLISRPYFTAMASLRELDCSSEIYNAILDYAFANMLRLEKITLPSTLTTLNPNAFRSCYSLKEINLDNIINFKGSCFYECFSLDKDIVFSSNLKSIDTNAFSRTRIKSVTFQTPTGDFPTVSNNAFPQCRNLTDVWLFDGWNMSVKFSDSDLSQASLHDMIEKYADMTGQEAPIMQVGSKNLEKIDDEHKAMATAKNVTLA